MDPLIHLAPQVKKGAVVAHTNLEDDHCHLHVKTSIGSPSALAICLMLTTSTRNVVSLMTVAESWKNRLRVSQTRIDL